MMTKLNDEVNRINPNYHGSQKSFYFGKAKISEGVSLWAGKWKPISNMTGYGGKYDDLTLEGRGFSLNEIDEVRLSREGLKTLIAQLPEFEGEIA
jgi:hypothetical protein|tara:strand:+ start:180 stop:464 length:285 start_codon:yes stop_codon:yes gene_type:complete